MILGACRLRLLRLLRVGAKLRTGLTREHAGTKNPTLLPTGNPKTPRERTALTSTTSVDLERDRGDSPPVERLASPSTAPASRPFPTTPVGSPPPNTNGLHVTRPTTPPQTPPQAPPQQAPPQASVDPPVLIATTPRASEPKVHTPRESVPVPSSARGPLTPAPPPRQVGGGMTTPRNHTLATPRASSTISDGVPLSPRSPLFARFEPFTCFEDWRLETDTRIE